MITYLLYYVHNDLAALPTALQEVHNCTARQILFLELYCMSDFENLTVEHGVFVNNPSHRMVFYIAPEGI